VRVSAVQTNDTSHIDLQDPWKPSGPFKAADNVGKSTFIVDVPTFRYRSNDSTPNYFNIFEHALRVLLL
jgi:hypothetical protein